MNHYQLQHQQAQLLKLKLDQKQQQAHKQKQQAQLLRIQRILHNQTQQWMKEVKIIENRRHIEKHHKIMKNYFTSVEDNFKQVQVRELVNNHKMVKLSPVRKHLDHWQHKRMQMKS